ncbi:MAG: hypothetical protein SO287_00670 [Parabacteroides sp.]|nr:hypothetical protein [Parabacteroides sp.]MDY4756112.1 hypothetical protein [Parabacteroides sp.]
MNTENLTVKFHSDTVGRLSLTPDNTILKREHATSVNSTSRPSFENFLAVGMKAKISPTRCRELYEQVRENLVNIE